MRGNLSPVKRAPGRAMPARRSAPWRESLIAIDSGQPVTSESQLRIAVTAGVDADAALIRITKPIYLVDGPLIIDDYKGNLVIRCEGEGLISTEGDFPLIRIGERGSTYSLQYPVQVTLQDCVIYGAAGWDAVEGLRDTGNQILQVVNCDVVGGVGGLAFGGDWGSLLISESRIYSDITIDDALRVEIRNCTRMGDIELSTGNNPVLHMTGNSNTAAYNVDVLSGGNPDFLISGNTELGDVDINAGVGSVVGNTKNIGSGNIDCTGCSNGVIAGNTGWVFYIGASMTIGNNA